MKTSYPVILSADSNMVSAEFIDIFGAVTFGVNEEHALKRASELLTMLQKTGKVKNILPSDKNKLIRKYPGKKIIDVEAAG